MFRGKQRISLISLLLICFSIPIVHADVITPIFGGTIFLFPLVLIIELIPFWLLVNKFLIKVSFRKALVIVAAANFLTSLFGSFYPIGSFYRKRLWLNLWGVIDIFIFTVIAEFVVYFLFFRKERFEKIKLLYVSLIINFFSYLFVFIFIIMTIFFKL